MSGRFRFLFTLLIVFMLSANSRASTWIAVTGSRDALSTSTLVPEDQVFYLDESPSTYDVIVFGDLDERNTWNASYPYRFHRPAWELNRKVTLRNIGTTSVKNPVIHANGRGPAWTMEDLLAKIIEPDMTDAEMARAAYEFIKRNVYHGNLYIFENKVPLGLYDILGFAQCFENSKAIANLWKTLGMDPFCGSPFGHATTVVDYDGDTHLFDGDMNAFFLLRDNQTVACESDLARDPDLVFRSTTHWPFYSLNTTANVLDLRYQAIQINASDRDDPQTVSTVPGVQDFTLRPQESLTLDFSQTDGVFRQSRISPLDAIHPLFCSASLDYTPLLDDSFLEVEEVEFRNVHCVEREAGTWVLIPDPSRDEEAALILRSSVPTILLEGIFNLTVEDDLGETTPPAVLVSFANDQFTPLEWDPGQDGSHSFSVSLARLLNVTSSNAVKRNGVAIQLVWPPDNQTAVTAIHQRLRFQMQYNALPFLRRGRNELVYHDDSDGERMIEIEHYWVESHNNPYLRPPHSQFPRDHVDSLQPVFQWDLPDDIAPDDVARIHLQVADRSDMKWSLTQALEPVYDVAPDAGQPTAWTPHRPGLLAPGETYYWRVRYKTQRGVWSPWSLTRSFVPFGPLPPVNLRIETVDGATVLRWDPNPDGTEPVRYEVHGSPQFGFTAYLEPQPFAIPAKNSTNYYQNYPDVQPSTLAGETTAREFRIFDDGNFPHALPVFCRVIAIDAEDARSDSSEAIELPRPVALAPDTMTLDPGQSFTFQVRTNPSLGRYFAKSTSEATYHCNFWNREYADFTMIDGPPWIEIDLNTGVVTATPPEDWTTPESVTLHITLSNPKGSLHQEKTIDLVPTGTSSSTNPE